MSWGSKTEIEIRRRILVSIWAYAYEFENTTIVDDFRFDSESALINPKMTTGNKTIDKFFKNRFQPDTGMWIREHPHLERIREIYETYFRGKY